MFKKDIFKGKDLKGILGKAKANSTYILFAIVIILLLILHFEKMSRMEDLAQAINRTEIELKSVKMLAGKQLNEANDDLKILIEESQKVYNIEQEQSKTLSIIPTDNAFFKKWLMSNHQENLKAIEDVRIELDNMKSTINEIKIEVNNIGIKQSSNNPTQKERVEAISI